MRTPLAALALAFTFAVFAAPAVAAPAAPGFEQALGSLRDQVLQTRAAQLKAKSAQDVTQADWDARDLSRRGMMLESTISDVRRRAADARRAPRPGQDPFLRSQVERALFDLRQWDQDLQMLERRTMTLAASAQKDPDAASAAQQLVYDAQDVASAAQQLSTDADWMSWDLRAAGFAYEAGELQRLAQDAAAQARQLGYDAQTILDRSR